MTPWEYEKTKLRGYREQPQKEFFSLSPYLYLDGVNHIIKILKENQIHMCVYN